MIPALLEIAVLALFLGYVFTRPATHKGCKHDTR